MSDNRSSLACSLKMLIRMLRKQRVTTLESTLDSARRTLMIPQRRRRVLNHQVKLTKEDASYRRSFFASSFKTRLKNLHERRAANHKSSLQSERNSPSKGTVNALFEMGATGGIVSLQL